jgi:Helix-turn-helix domain
MKQNTQKLQYDYKSAAELLSLSPAALRDLVYKGRGPITVKIGRRTFFAHRDLLDFVENHRARGLMSGR